MSKVTWYAAQIQRITTAAPQQAFTLAALEAAGVGAKLIRSTYTGTLARDVSRPKPVAPLVAEVGSSLPYAAIENFGGIIRPRRYPRLYIRGRRMGTRGLTRSSFGAPIVATATTVEHRGKHYLEAILEAFPPRMIAHLRRLIAG